MAFQVTNRAMEPQGHNGIRNPRRNAQRRGGFPAQGRRYVPPGPVPTARDFVVDSALGFRQVDRVCETIYRRLIRLPAIAEELVEAHFRFLIRGGRQPPCKDAEDGFGFRRNGKSHAQRHVCWDY